MARKASKTLGFWKEFRDVLSSMRERLTPEKGHKEVEVYVCAFGAAAKLSPSWYELGGKRVLL